MTSGIPTTWVNSDGLLVRYGPTESTSGTGGAYEDHEGGTEIFEFRLILANLGSAATGTGALADPNGTIMFPATGVLEKVELFVEVAAAGSSATLSMGFLNASTGGSAGTMGTPTGTFTNQTTDSSGNGILNAETQSHLGTLGRRWIYTVSGGFLDGAPGTTSSQQGTLLGAVPAYDVLMPTAYYSTAAFTAGIIAVRLYVNFYARDAILA